MRQAGAKVKATRNEKHASVTGGNALACFVYFYPGVRWRRVSFLPVESPPTRDMRRGSSIRVGEAGLEPARA